MSSVRRIAITGPDGFLAWHTRCALRAHGDFEELALGRSEFDDPAAMDGVLRQADGVIHLAGVNRAADDRSVAEVNPWLAQQLKAARVPGEAGGRVIAFGAGADGLPADLAPQSDLTGGPLRVLPGTYPWCTATASIATGTRSSGWQSGRRQEY